MSKKLKYIISAIAVVLIVGIAYTFIFLTRNFGSGLADYTYKIAGSCRLVRTSAHQITIGCENIKTVVGPKVISVGWNENFLLAESHPLGNNGSESSYQVPDESVTYWWIIDLKNKKGYGPLQSADEFNKQKAILGAENVELWSIDQAKAKGTRVNGDFNN